MPCLMILYSSCMLGVLALVSGTSVRRSETGSSSHQGCFELLLAAMRACGHRLPACCMPSQEPAAASTPVLNSLRPVVSPQEAHCGRQSRLTCNARRYDHNLRDKQRKTDCRSVASRSVDLCLVRSLTSI